MTERRFASSGTRRDRNNEFALRLRRILTELSYAQGTRISVAAAARAIAMRTTRPFTETKLRELLYRGQIWTAADLKQVADGLQIDPRELLYEPLDARKQTRSVTSRRKRPVRSVWDELDNLPTPER